MATEKTLEELRVEIKRQKERLNTGVFEGLSKTKLPDPSNIQNLAPRRTLRGHYGSVYALQWGGGNAPDTLVSVGQDNKLIVWDAYNMWKLTAISEANWAMTVGIEPERNETCGYAGLDYNIYLYDIRGEDASDEPSLILTGTHVAYVSCINFFDGNQLLSSSGDNTCTHWDITTGTAVARFVGHKKDVMRLAKSEIDKHTFVTASVDKTCKLWDIRERNAVMEFDGHTADINTVDFFPDGNAFASGGDDSTVILHDKRAGQSINTFVADNNRSPVNSLAFSSSGRVLFAGYDTMTPFAWDVFNPNNKKTRLLPAHSFKISCLGVNQKGTALASGAWDHVIKIWA